MPIVEIVGTDKRNSASTYLLESAKDVCSQFGEDGILQKVFDIIGTNNKWCVEFGAWDGVHLSNTCHLIRDHGWMGVQIEGHKSKFDALQKNFAELKNAIQIRATIGYTPGADTIEDALKSTAIPLDFDLISIDIDGNDYHVWASIETYRPRVVVIEFNPTIPNDVVFIQDRDMSVNEGCSLAALIRLGGQKGYELVCATRANGIFVLKEEFQKFAIADNHIDSMRADSPGRIFYGYNGKVYQTLNKFTWALKGTPATPDMLQILPETQRVWKGKLPEPKKKKDPPPSEQKDQPPS